MSPGPPPGGLPPARSVLAVCAHPDDESFGLGAVLSGFAEGGAEVALLCLTCGEASTLGAGVDLADRRRLELAAAAAELGAGHVDLRDHPDGALCSVGLDRLAGEVAAAARLAQADLVVVFDEGGITGHPDHCRATEAALAATPHLPVLAWALPRHVADALNGAFGASFVGRQDDALDLVVDVDRTRQHRAIACHASQLDDNPVVARRLALLGRREWLRWLRPPGHLPPGPGSAVRP